MDKRKMLDQIPDNWFNLVDQGERDELTKEISEKMIQIQGLRIKGSALGFRYNN